MFSGYRTFPHRASPLTLTCQRGRLCSCVYFLNEGIRCLKFKPFHHIPYFNHCLISQFYETAQLHSDTTGQYLSLGVFSNFLPWGVCDISDERLVASTGSLYIVKLSNEGGGGLCSCGLPQSVGKWPTDEYSPHQRPFL